MKKTLCYGAIAREIGKMKSDGFIIVEIENEKIVNIEGIFTVDYLKTEICDDVIKFEYYVWNKTLIAEFSVKAEDIELPGVIGVWLKNDEKFEITVNGKISDVQLENYYKQCLKKIKK